MLTDVPPLCLGPVVSGAGGAEPGESSRGARGPCSNPTWCLWSPAGSPEYPPHAVEPSTRLCIPTDSSPGPCTLREVKTAPQEQCHSGKALEMDRHPLPSYLCPHAPRYPAQPAPQHLLGCNTGVPLSPAVPPSTSTGRPLAISPYLGQQKGPLQQAGSASAPAARGLSGSPKALGVGKTRQPRGRAAERPARALGCSGALLLSSGGSTAGTGRLSSAVQVPFSSVMENARARFQAGSPSLKKQISSLALDSLPIRHGIAGSSFSPEGNASAYKDTEELEGRQIKGPSPPFRG